MVSCISCTVRKDPVYPARLVDEGIIVPGMTRSWYEPYRFEGRHCSVRSNIGPRAASWLGALVDAAFQELQRTFGVDCDEKVTVVAYATLGEFRRSAANPSFTARTRGTHYPGTGEIHLTMTADATSEPSAIVLHETAHFYLHRCFDFRRPAERRTGAGPQRLASVPRWLQEGVATCMEALCLEDGRLRAGRISLHRLRELEDIIGTARFPGIERVIRKVFGTPMSTEDYAVAWGIVHTLLYHPAPSVRAARRETLKTYLAHCRRGFFDRPAAAFKAFLADGGEPGPGFRRRWADWVSRNSLELFRELFLEEADSLDAWRRRWENEIRSLRRSAAGAIE